MREARSETGTRSVHDFVTRRHGRPDNPQMRHVVSLEFETLSRAPDCAGTQWPTDLSSPNPRNVRAVRPRELLFAASKK